MSSKSVDFARKLRKESTDAERKLWRRLKRNQLGGLKFRRQHPIGKYIVDFICCEKKLILELDGGQHGKDDGKAKDQLRDKWLNERGYTVLRFWNHEILKNIDGILQTIYKQYIR